MSAKSTNSQLPSSFVQIAQEAARLAGDYLQDCGLDISISEKQPGDLVTSADIEAQRIIFGHLEQNFPTHQMFGEEGQLKTDWNLGYCWIVDPIDGTKNFVHQLPSYSISIALLNQGIPVVGIVFDPRLDEMFTAQAGIPPTLNSKPICPSATQSLSKALLVSSFPSKVNRDTPELLRFIEVVQRATMRRLGSAALNLCYVACGRLDGYWATTLNVWDFAAGMLIAKEAGAVVKNLAGDPFGYQMNDFCVCSTESLSNELLPLLQIPK